MNDALLSPDCTRCAALCCVSLAFDRSAFFAFDKEPGVPCRHLTAEHRCGIHQDLASRGFTGCIRYECSGAGQRVTQEIFGGRSWRDDPALAQPMFDAFRAMRQVHELLLLLQTAGRLPLAPPLAQRRGDLVAALQPPGGWSVGSLAAFEQGSLPGEVRAFLVTLRGSVPPGWNTPRRLPVVE